jgi:diguanylate cyclase (GGDEF)-like protein
MSELETGNRRKNDLTTGIDGVRALAAEFNMEPDPPELKEDSHFWFLVLLIMGLKRDEIWKTIAEEIEIIRQLGNVELIESITQKLALKFAMDIIKAGDVDVLTGAWTRNSLFDRIQLFQDLIKTESLSSDAEKEESEYILLLHFIDLDHFKSINDTYLHTGGAEVLKKLVKVINEQIRDEDAIFRYGGEEFCVLQFVNKNNLDKASKERNIPVQDLMEEMVENLRRSITAALIFNFGNEETKVTLSMGVVQIPPEEDGLAAVNRADDLMYVAKKTGRDRSFFEWSQLSGPASLQLKLKKIFVKDNQ